MPGGSAAQQSFIPEPQQESPDETGNLLAADKARSAVDFDATAPNDNTYKPYTEGPRNDNNIPQEQGETAPEEGFNQTEEAWFEKGVQQDQLDAQQQAEAAASLQGSKQRQLRQIQMERQGIESKLKELEKDLTDFKNSKMGGLLKIFQPRMNLLIDILISEMKKQASKLTDEAKIGYYTGLIITVTSLIGMFTAIRMFTGVLDAAFIHQGSCLRLVIVFSETIVIPIILILISPIYITFLALIFIMGKIPLLKGKLTKNVIDIIIKLKKQKEAWQKELTRLKKVVSLKKQLKSLNKFEKQVKRWR